MAYKQVAQLPFNPLDNRLYDIDSFPRQAIPTTVGLLMKRTVKNAYVAPYGIDGADMIARAIMSIYLSAYQPSQTVQAIDRVYRLLDISLNGVEYIMIDGKPQEPAIIPNNLQYSETVRGKLEDIKQAILNQSSGGELDDEILAELAKIALLLV